MTPAPVRATMKEDSPEEDMSLEGLAMHRIFIANLMAFTVALVGCGPSETPPPASSESPAQENKRGFSLEIPGVEVNVDSEGIGVSAPGTSVRAGTGQGIEVRAPGTEVDANWEKGVRVKTDESP